MGIYRCMGLDSAFVLVLKSIFYVGNVESDVIPWTAAAIPTNRALHVIDLYSMYHLSLKCHEKNKRDNSFGHRLPDKRSNDN